MKIRSAGVSVPGKVRTNNEDNFYIDGRYKEDFNKNEFSLSSSSMRLRHVYAVCDGMGGYEFGEKAAWIALRVLKKYDTRKINSKLEEYSLAANKEICTSEFFQNNQKRGTTLALVTISKGELCQCTVGDSRIYLFRKNKLTLISRDHTRGQSMVEAGIITKEESKGRKDLKVLSQYLGVPEDEFVICPDIKKDKKLYKGDIVIICSDGLTDMVDDGEIEEILYTLKEEEPKKIAENLTDRAVKNGGVDNVTVVVIKMN